VSAFCGTNNETISYKWQYILIAAFPSYYHYCFTPHPSGWTVDGPAGDQKDSEVNSRYSREIGLHNNIQTWCNSRTLNTTKANVGYVRQTVINFTLLPST